MAPGETAPNQVRLNGIEVEGVRLRYVRLSEDSNEIDGFGVLRVSGIVAFPEPATFGLKKLSNGEVRILTDTGVALNRQWLDGEVRCIEALNLDRQWLDVTKRCEDGSIPTHLVKEWADRNQRSLVEFRVLL